MSAPLISFTHEIDVLTETENAVKTTFQHCREMIKDVLEYNPNAHADLSKLMMQIKKLAESKREIDSLIYATNEINSLTSKVNLSEDEASAKFEELFDEFVEENEIDDEHQGLLNSLCSYLNNEREAEVEMVDSEVLVTKATESYLDPLTRCRMIDPVRSINCNHAYERDSIMGYLGDSTKRCPYSGCQHMLSRRDLVEHFVLKMKLSLNQTSEDS